VFRPGEAVREMGSCAESLCFVGHSHVPGTFEIRGARATYTRAATVDGARERRYLIVVPSVGQPRDGDPRAGYLLWDDEAWTFEHVRLEYDLERAVDRILDAGLPPYLAERLHWGE
jgi:diadenosine tetraphosphatase ApaH/serine/threonine PP2A family protein phosphatase